MPPPLPQIRPATKRERSDAAVVAARALHDDPLFVFLSQDPITRARGMLSFWQAWVATTAAAGETYVAAEGDEVVGVAAWTPPGGFPLPAAAQVRQTVGATRALARRPNRIPDGLRYLLAIEKVHPHDEHWYLALLSVDPTRHGRGIGGALVEHVTAKADAQGLPCYLETSKERNLAWYSRSGFDQVEELRPVKKGPPVWTMRREPR